MSCTALHLVQLKADTHAKLFTCPSKVDGFISERIAATRVTWPAIIVWITKVRCLRNCQKDRCQIVFVISHWLTYSDPISPTGDWTNNSGGLRIFEGQGWKKLEGIRSNTYYLYCPKLQSHCLNGLYNLCSEWYLLDPWFEWGKTFNRGVAWWKKHQEEPQDQQTCSICCMYRTEPQNHSLHCTERISSINYNICKVCGSEEADGAARGIAKCCPSHTTSSPPWWLGQGQATQDN